MSVNTNQSRDTSTENANWGTLVILLMLAVVTVFIGVALYSDNQKPAAPITVTAPTSSAVPAPATPSITGTTAPAAPVSPAPSATNGTAPVSGTGQ